MQPIQINVDGERVMGVFL